MPDADELRLIGRLLKFLDQHYAARGAYAAAIDGAQRLLQESLSANGRVQVLTALAPPGADTAPVNRTAQRLLQWLPLPPK